MFFPCQNIVDLSQDFVSKLFGSDFIKLLAGTKSLDFLALSVNAQE